MVEKVNPVSPAYNKNNNLAIIGFNLCILALRTIAITISKINIIIYL